MKQLQQLDANYPGGLQKYITNARRLLEESKSGERPPECHISKHRWAIDAAQFLSMHAPQS